MTSVEQLATARNRHLPHPDSERFVPLRAGILDVWEYDQQEFWFAGGRLVLRGQNTAGKSKALELLFPFVLDGDSRPERLDPFGNRTRTMRWNLIDFDDDRKTATGYCWLEFGRVDEDGIERYVTVLVGLRANRTASSVAKWFAVTDQRVGADFKLVGGDGRALSQDRLREVLGADRVGDNAPAHRVAVDKALFGLGPDRFDALIHLILQLRRPKLSEKLNPDTLSTYLTDALPPLDRVKVDTLTEAFTRLEADAAELEQLAAASAEVARFLAVYREYAQVHARARAREVTQANNAFDDVTRVEKQQRDLHDQAVTQLREVEARAAEVKARAHELEGQLSGLDLTKVHAFAEISRSAAVLERVARQAAERSSEAARVAAGDGEAMRKRAEEAEAAAAAFETSTTVALEAAERSGVVVEHRAHAEQLVVEPGSAEAALKGAVDRRRSLIGQVQARAAEAAEVQTAIALAAARAAEADAALADADATHAEATAEEGRQRADYVAAVEQWWTDVQVAPVALPAYPDEASRPRPIAELVDRSGLDGESVADGALASLQPDRTVMAAVTAAMASGRELVAELDRRVAADHRIATDALRSLERERASVAAERESGPLPTPGRANADESRVALWQVVDFRDEVGDTARANLEAALQAAGLLDAAVTPAGLVDHVHDAVVVGIGDPVESSVLTWLRPGDDVPDRDHVTAILAAIGAGAGSGAGCWFDVADGAWANGALVGRATKEEAAYIGAAARAAARARRLAELDQAIAHARVGVADLEGVAASISAVRTALTRAEAAFPPIQSLAEASSVARRAAVEAERRRRALDETRERLHRERERGREALTALAKAETTAGCSVAEVASVERALSDYLVALVAAVSASRASTAAAAAAAAARERAAESSDRAAQADADRASAESEAIAKRAEADELQRTTGAEVAELQARQAELEQGIQTANEERDELDGRRQGAVAAMAGAEARLEQAVADRVAAEHRRARALAAFAELTGTELAALAVGVEPDGDVSQPTAGLRYARLVNERLKEVGVDQAAVDAVENRLQGDAYPSLRTKLASQFDPHLDKRDGLDVFAARLGGEVIGAGALDTALRTDVDRRRAILSQEEADIIERHLVDELGAHLGQRAHGAWDLVRRMNDQLRTRATRSGVSLRLEWAPDPSLGPAGVAALKLLERDVSLLDAGERAALNAFLRERVRAAREEGHGATDAERLGVALDYRRWHVFNVYRRTQDGREQKFTNRSHAAGSGGEQAKLAHLPLFAAIAGYYASAVPTAPHLLVLDEAFAGIDEDQRADCMGMLVDLDLDVVLANYGEWGCYRTVPAIAVYHLERTPGVKGVAALRFVWNGRDYDEDDPFLDGRTPELGGLFAGDG